MYSGRRRFWRSAADPAELAGVGAEARAARSRRSPAATADPAAAAERWARAEVALRLRCFENWLTERIRGAGSGRGPL